MARTLLSLLAAGILQACTSPPTLPIHHATTAELGFVVDGDTSSWTLAPEMRPDEFTHYCMDDSGVVELLGTVPPARYVLTPGDTVDFVVVLDGDSAHTRFIGRAWLPPARFTPEYAEAHRGQWSVEVPETMELMLIAIALTPTGMANSNMIAHTGGYHRAVLDHFGPHRHSPVVQALEAMLAQDPMRFAHLVMDANAFQFTDDRLVPDPVYDRLSWGPENVVRPLVEDLAQFAQVSNFRAFHARHTALYDSLRADTRAAMPVDAMWRWLEERFPERYDHYRILISPLMEGFHCTNHFDNAGFRQSVMAICPAWNLPTWSPGMREGRNTRIVFTEIDHNYVNPVSDAHVGAIQAALADLAHWATDDARAAYHNSYAVFNEYMTFGVFLLYARDRLPADDFGALRTSVVRNMERGRGFPRFGAFQTLLEQVYDQAPTRDIPALYPALLAECRTLAP